MSQYLLYQILIFNMARIEQRPSGLAAVHSEIIVPGPRKPKLYDTTLRDGQQRRDVGYDVEGKVRVANQIFTTLPVSHIEGGWPGANPTDTEFFRRSLDEPYHPILSAFGMTRRAGVHVEDDKNIANLLASNAPFVTLVGKSDTMHVEKVFHTTKEENLAMIEDSVRFVRDQGRRVIYDAEHFFDGARRDPEYAMETLYAAARGGAEAVVLCDTNGGRMPWEIEEWVRRVVSDERLHEFYQTAYNIEDPTAKIEVGIHTHQDRSMAEANSLYAIRAGATHVQGTVNGMGERVGNANILVIADELANEGLVPLTAAQRRGFVALTDTVYDASGAARNPHSPLVGENAFATTAGMHQDATLKEPAAYTHRDPKEYGNRLKIYINNQSGKRAVAERARQLGLELPDQAIPVIIEEIKEQEFKGLRFSRAEASLDLLMRRHEASYTRPFNLSMEGEKTQLTVPNTQDAAEQQVVPLRSTGERTSAVYEDIRSALAGRYPQVNSCYFDGDRIERVNGTTRVFIRTANTNASWTTVGVGPDLRSATLAAISDALEYGIYHNSHPKAE